MAQDILNQQIATRESDAQAEQIAGQGVDGVRTCVGGFIFGVCRQWQIVTPGSTIAGVVLRLLTAAYELAINTHTTGEDAATAFFKSVGEKIANFVPSANNQTPPAASAPSPENPCAGAEPCENTGWNGGGADQGPDTVPSQTSSGNTRPGVSSGSGFNIGLSAIFGSLNNLDSYGNSPGSGGGGSGGGIDFELPDYDLAITLPEPKISDFAILTDGAGFQHLIWHTTDTFICFAVNNWPGLTTPIMANQVLPTNGDWVINNSISFEAGYQMSCAGLNPTTPLATATAQTP